MAIQFNDTDTGRGLVQQYEQRVGHPAGFVSSNTAELKKFTARANNALDRYFALAIQASGTWQLDDSNHDDYQAIYATLTSGRKDYKFLTDEDGNAILDIYKVLILPSSTATEYIELEPVDETLSENVDFLNENSTTGTPTRYSKRSNAIFFDVSPNYTVARGIKVLVNRESDYFTYTDTTKKAGYPYHQEYFFLKPAYDEISINGSPEQYDRISKDILDLQGDVLSGRAGLIQKAYGSRSKDESLIIKAREINSI